MPTIPCPNAITCPNGGDDPIGNFSSEAVDSIEFLALGYWLYGPPVYPFSPAIPTTGTPTIDGGGAGDPGTAATQTQGDENQTIINNTPARPTPPAYPPQVVVTNDSQSCAYTCPDGSLFTYTVPAGTFFGLNKVLLNRQANTYACRQASRHHNCLTQFAISGFPPGACISNHFSGTIVISHGEPPFDFAVTSGALPSGVLIGQAGTFSILVTGLPQEIGSFHFTVQVTDAVGRIAMRDYTINVLGVTNPDLPDATVGTPYSEAFSASGGAAPFTFDIQSGTLPDGLTMDGNGVVSGTPTTSGVSDFTIGVTSGDGNVCEVDCAINVTGVAGPDWPSIVWDTATTYGFGGASGTISAVGPNVSASGQGVDFVSSGGAILHGSLTYTGPACTCKVSVLFGTHTANADYGVEVLQDGVSVLALFDPVVGVYTFNLLLSVNSVIVVHGSLGGDVVANGGAGNPPLVIPSGFANWTFKLSN